MIDALPVGPGAACHRPVYEEVSDAGLDPEGGIMVAATSLRAECQGP